MGVALDVEDAVARRNGQAQQVVFAEIGRRLPLPEAPAALAVDVGRHRFVDMGERGDHAGLRGNQIGLDIEPVLVGRGIEQDVQPVALVAAGLGGDVELLVQDMGGAVEIEIIGGAEDRLIELDQVELDAADVDLQVWKQGTGLFLVLGRVELRLAQHLDLGAGQVDNIDMFAEIAERMPVEMDQVALQEDALGVVEFQAVDGHVAVERAVEAVDADLEAGIELQAGGVLDQDAPADGCVEAGQEDADNDENGDDDAGYIDSDAAPRKGRPVETLPFTLQPRPNIARRWCRRFWLGDRLRFRLALRAARARLITVLGRRGHGRFLASLSRSGLFRFFGHQKACPMPT